MRVSQNTPRIPPRKEMTVHHRGKRDDGSTSVGEETVVAGCVRNRIIWWCVNKKSTFSPDRANQTIFCCFKHVRVPQPNLQSMRQPKNKTSDITDRLDSKRKGNDLRAQKSWNKHLARTLMKPPLRMVSR